ncbi:MAG: hypothetical protein EBZ47_08850 [Chlamydiae bacterium]|nr:hypothetical protein [Chlamydiota bacterium]
MNRFRRFGSLSLFLALSTYGSIFGNTIDNDDDFRAVDINALVEWMNTKRQVTIKEIGGNLSLSGEVRTELQATGESANGVKQRGFGSAPIGPENTFLPAYVYDVEVDLMLDYRIDRGWASIRIAFDNDAGIFGGTLNKLKLTKGYFGTRLVDTDSTTFDIELGRRRLGNVFDSNLMFAAFMDGVLFRYDVGLERVGDAYAHLGAYLIDERVNQYGYVGELGLLNIASTGLYTKYSLIDWDTKNYNNTIDNLRFQFLVSQLILGYKCFPPSINRPIRAYLAGLYNHKADKHDFTDNKRANYGGYLGFSIGEIRKRGDFALDINYQVLAAQCVPDFDVSGIGIGNAINAGLYTTVANAKGTKAISTVRENAAGNGNFRGYVVTLDYLLTNNLNFQQQWQQSITLDKNIGPFRRYKQYEIEFIYGF